MKPLHSNQLTTTLSVVTLVSVMFITSCTKDVLPGVEEKKESITVKVPGQDIKVTSTSYGCSEGFRPNEEIGEGLYLIQSRTNPALVLEVPNSNYTANNVIIQQNLYCGRGNQIWKVSKAGYIEIDASKGVQYYNISPYWGSKTLDVPNGSFAPFVKIQLYEKKSTSRPDSYNQQWRINGIGGIATISNRQTVLALNAPNGNAGTQIQQWVMPTSWKFIKVPPADVFMDSWGRPLGWVHQFLLDPTKPGCYTDTEYNTLVF